MLSAASSMHRRVPLKRLSEPLRAIARCSKVAKYVALGMATLAILPTLPNIFAVCVAFFRVNLTSPQFSTSLRVFVTSVRSYGAVIVEDKLRAEIDLGVEKLLDERSKDVGLGQRGELIAEFEVVENLLNV